MNANITIAASPENVIAFISVANNLPLWSEILGVEKISGNGQVGAEYKITVKSLLFKTNKKIRITKNSTSQFGFVILGIPANNEVFFNIDAAEHETKVTAHANYGSQAVLVANLNKLKLILEKQYPLEKEHDRSEQEDQELKFLKSNY